ncbi:hypothetical protein V8Z80_07950 [Orrella sp. JC864]|uniref:hypothetical protein n=1 Tax=Orrella sp. JC864 TaxID=3120298 RepID=UPI00300AF749
MKCTKYGAPLMLAAGLSCLPAPARPHPGPASAWSQAPTVQDLMRLDLQAALAAAGAAPPGHVPGPAHVPAATPAQPLAQAPRVLAIYGVGKRMHAEMLVDGHRHRLSPDGPADWDGAYHLLEVRGHCLKAARAGQAPLTLCLGASGQER